MHLKGEFLEMKSVAVNRKNYVKIALFFLLSLLVIGALFSSTTRVYAEPNAADQTQTSGTSLSDISTKSQSVIADIQKPIVAIATAVGGLAMIICVVMILFTHDDKKIAGYIKIVITIIIALLVIYLINGNVIIDIVKNIAQSLGGKVD